MTEAREQQIQRRLAAIKRHLQKIGDLRPGTLTQQYKHPDRQEGPYHQLSYTHQMKSRTEYVRTDAVPRIKKEIDNYEKLRELVKEWIELGIEASKLKTEQAKK